jgi:hypothetical protein
MIQEEILILKEISYKENDKILHALSRTRGKHTADEDSEDFTGADSWFDRVPGDTTVVGG